MKGRSWMLQAVAIVRGLERRGLGGPRGEPAMHLAGRHRGNWMQCGLISDSGLICIAKRCPRGRDDFLLIVRQPFRCNTCMNSICLWKDEHKDKQTEYDTKHYENNKDNIIKQQCEKTTCNVCNSLVMKCNLKKHQETDICKRNHYH